MDGFTETVDGKPLVPTTPPEWFDCFSFRILKQLMLILEGSADGDQWGISKQKIERLVSVFPDLRAEYLGQCMPMGVFQGDFKGNSPKVIKAICKTREGEVLKLCGEWKGPFSTQDFDQMIRSKVCWHVQYGRDATQRWQLNHAHCPGSLVANMNLASLLPINQVHGFGESNVLRFRDVPGGQHECFFMWEGLVVTWPQMFLMGLQNGYTAMEIFAFGVHHEKVVARRVHQKKSMIQKDAKAYHRSTLWGGRTNAS